MEKLAVEAEKLFIKEQSRVSLSGRSERRPLRDLFHNDMKTSICKGYWNLNVEGLCNTAISYMKSENAAFILGECFLINWIFSLLHRDNIFPHGKIWLRYTKQQVWQGTGSIQLYKSKEDLYFLWGKQCSKCFWFWKVHETPPFYLFFKRRMKWAISQL